MEWEEVTSPGRVGAEEVVLPLLVLEGMAERVGEIDRIDLFYEGPMSGSCFQFAFV